MNKQRTTNFVCMKDKKYMTPTIRIVNIQKTPIICDSDGATESDASKPSRAFSDWGED